MKKGEGRLFKKALALIMIVTGAGMVGLLDPSPVDATGHSATRSFSAATVEPGGELVVTIEAAGFGSAAYIEETLPAGFTFVSSNHSDGQADGQTVSVALFDGESPFTYTVTASATAGDYDFDGFIRDFPAKDERDVGGATRVTVEASAVTPSPSPSPSPTTPPADGGPSATRSLPDSTVEAGDQVVVSITAADYGLGGLVIEMLPAGFAYVASSLSDPAVTVDGREVSFSILSGAGSFTYTVTASRAAGDYDFSGIIRDFNRDEAPVGGDSSITVEAGPVVTPARATRSFSDSTVEAGDQVVVSITATEYGLGGLVIETLPAGFSYVSSNLSDPAVTVDGQELSFSILSGTGSFTYTVAASRVVGDHDFSGIIRDFNRDEAPVGGDSTITVEAGAPASATRSFSDSMVEPGDQVVVSIEADEYGLGGLVIETLPAGFAYVSSSLTAPRAVTVDGQQVSFSIISGSGSFTYTVTASSVVGEYTFSGIIRDFDQDEAPVGGDSEITVGTPAPVETPTPVTPSPSPTATPPPTTGISPTTARVPTLTVGGSSTRVNLPSIFSDLETDGLTYTAVSSRSSVVRARVSGIILRLTPVGAGTSRITVTATDADGTETRRTFTVRVRAAELPPVGGLTAPDWLLALLALAGAALVPVGVLTLRSRRRRAVP